MNIFAQFFVMAITALAVENAVFALALGLNKTVLFMSAPKKCILYGATLTWVAVFSSMFVPLINMLMAESEIGVNFIRAPLYLVGVVVVYAATYLVTKQWFPKIFRLVAPALPVSTFNTALFGALYMTTLHNLSFFVTIGYALGAGAGYTAALLIIYYARKRLAISPVPRSFRGLPILLLYIGLLSLAIYGLLGHGVAT